MAALDRFTNLIPGRNPIARIAINMRPSRGPWGGGNQWLNQIVRSLRFGGYSVQFDLKSPVDCIIMVDPRVSNTVPFGAADIRRYKDLNPDTVCIQRINENDQRKNTDFMDALLAKANEVADFTVFISSWLRDYHAERWFDLNRPHTVIINGADERFFHPIGSAEYRVGHPLRLVTHHWSDNWMKGFAVYQEIDQLIATGELSEIELWVIGRWPREIEWQTAKTFGPTQGVQLANLLRKCHVYVTASLWEPGGMHFIEGVQCGLPLLYHLDGGGINEVGCDFGIGFREDIRPAIIEMKNRYPAFRQAVLKNAPSGERMCLAYKQVIQQTIVSQAH